MMEYLNWFTKQELLVQLMIAVVIIIGMNMTYCIARLIIVGKEIDRDTDNSDYP